MTTKPAQQALYALGQQMPIGGHRQISHAHGMQPRNVFFDALAHQRLTAGDAYLLYTQ